MSKKSPPKFQYPIYHTLLLSNLWMFLGSTRGQGLKSVDIARPCLCDTLERSHNFANKTCKVLQEFEVVSCLCAKVGNIRVASATQRSDIRVVFARFKCVGRVASDAWAQTALYQKLSPSRCIAIQNPY